jgi:hypothetical protein
MERVKDMTKRSNYGFMLVVVFFENNIKYTDPKFSFLVAIGQSQIQFEEPF